jgi:hypothetical protein
VAVAAVASVGLVGGMAPGATAAPRELWVVPGVNNAGGPSPTDLGTADFDGDGVVDVVVANINRSGLVVLPGTGGTVLGPPVLTPLPSAGAAIAVEVADFDEDGRPDVVAAVISDAGSTLKVLTGDGDGTFTSRYSRSSGSERLAVGDLNGDGHVDVVASAGGSQGDQLEVSFGNGDGTLGAPAVYPPPFFIGVSDVEVADVDRDGDLDVVYAEGPPVTRLNDGTGALGARIVSADSQGRLSAYTLEVGDLTGDGMPDVVLGDASGGRVTIAAGQGDGRFTFSSAVAGVAYQVAHLALADLTGDGRLDVLAPGDLDFGGVERVLAVLAGTPAGTLAAPERWNTGGASPTPVDLDGDGVLDVVATDDAGGTVWAVRNAGRARLRAPRVTVVNQPGFLVGSLDAADVDGDGRSDVVVRLPQDVGVYRGQPGGTLGPLQRSPVPELPLGTAFGDLDEDGRTDVVMSGDSPNLFWSRGNGDGTFGAATVLDSRSTAAIYSVQVGDVNGDGHLDVAAITAGRVTVLRGNGDGTFQPAEATGTANGGLHLADMDGDGDLDAVSVERTGTTNFSSSRVRVNANDGTARFIQVQTVSLPNNNSGSVVADLLGDPLPEVANVGPRGTDGGVSGLFVLPNIGGTLGPAIRHPAGISDIAAADVDGDGDTDLATLATTSPGRSVQVFTALDRPGLGSPTAYPGFVNPDSLVLADTTGDGRPEIATVRSSNPSQLALYQHVS